MRPTVAASPGTAGPLSLLPARLAKDPQQQLQQHLPRQHASGRTVFRGAADVFAQLPTRDVAKVLESTKMDAERKREELRELVGRRYHDLVDSADAIIGMHSTVEKFEVLVGAIEAKASSLTSAPSLVVAPAAPLPTPAAANGASHSRMNGETPVVPMSESEAVDRLLRTPHEIWRALDDQNERGAAELLVDALRACGEVLRAEDRAHAMSAPLAPPDAEEEMLAEKELSEAAARLELSPATAAAVQRLARRVRETRRRRAGEAKDGVWSRYPFLQTQWEVLSRVCRGDVQLACEAALMDRSADPKHLERTRGALTALRQLGDPRDSLAAFLAARAAWVAGFLAAPSGAGGASEDAVVSVVETAARTLQEAFLVVAAPRSAVRAELDAWLTRVAAALAPRVPDLLTRRVDSVAGLASLQAGLAAACPPGALPEEWASLDLVRRLLGDAVEKRAILVVDAAYDAAAARFARRALRADAAAPAEAVRRLEKRLALIEAVGARDAPSSAWALGLHDAFEKCAQELQEQFEKDSSSEDSLSKLQSTTRAFQALASSPVFQRHASRCGAPETASRLVAVAAGASRFWVDKISGRLVAEHFDAHASRAEARLQASASNPAVVRAGWTRDAELGDLPGSPSLEAFELCFRTCRAGAALEEDAARALGLAVWHKMYATYAHCATLHEKVSSDLKLLAAFDLEFASFVLIGGPRPPKAFEHGGVDVYAAADRLRSGAQACARRAGLVMLGGAGAAAAPASAEELAVSASGAPLLTLVEPVARFSLLPVQALPGAGAGSAQARRVSPSPRLQRQGSSAAAQAGAGSSTSAAAEYGRKAIGAIFGGVSW